MKTALLLFLVLASATAVPKPPTSPTQAVTWGEIHTYIESHATNYRPATESQLWNESVMGRKTWEVTGSGQNARRDGGGIGWPRYGETITFSTRAEAEELGVMVDEFRESQIPIIEDPIPPRKGSEVEPSQTPLPGRELAVPHR